MNLRMSTAFRIIFWIVLTLTLFAGLFGALPSTLFIIILAVLLTLGGLVGFVLNVYLAISKYSKLNKMDMISDTLCLLTGSALIYVSYILIAFSGGRMSD